MEYVFGIGFVIMAIFFYLSYKENQVLKNKVVDLTTKLDWAKNETTNMRLVAAIDQTRRQEAEKDAAKLRQLNRAYVNKYTKLRNRMVSIKRGIVE